MPTALNQISALDYNTLRNKIITILGSGVASRGYGQPIYSSPVVAGNLITAQQWNELRTDLVNIRVHQTGTTPVLPTPATGKVIGYNASNPLTAYDTVINAVDATRFEVSASQAIISQKGETSTNSNWSQSASCTVTVTFASANQARWFFNSGGKIRFTSSRTGGTSSTQNSSWSNLLTWIGTIEFGGNTPGANYYTLTNSYQQVYRSTSKNSAAYGSVYTPVSKTVYSPIYRSVYASNYYKIEALCNVANNSTGTANVITFKISWVDSYVDYKPSPPPDLVNGLLKLTVSELRAFGSFLPSGNFTVAPPVSYSLSAISYS